MSDVPAGLTGGELSGGGYSTGFGDAGLPSAGLSGEGDWAGQLSDALGGFWGGGKSAFTGHGDEASFFGPIMGGTGYGKGAQLGHTLGLFGSLSSLMGGNPMGMYGMATHGQGLSTFSGSTGGLTGLSPGDFGDVGGPADPYTAGQQYAPSGVQITTQNYHRYFDPMSEGFMYWNRLAHQEATGGAKQKAKTGSSDADKLVAQYGGTIDAHLQTQQGLLDELLGTGLTPEERASFDAQYQSELDALTAEYDRLTERQGAARLSELTHRGVLDTTTGERIMAEDQAEWTRMFTGAQSQLETSKLGAMEDFESAKKGMNLAKYQLHSDMTQKQIDLALAASMSQQNYLMGKGGIKANEALNQALIQQQQSKLDYDERSQLWGTVSGVGMDLLKSGLSGLF